MKQIVNIEKIWEKINKYEIISFDVFDTLIKRDVSSPKVIFDIVEQRYNDSHTVQINNFRKIRILAEKIARKHSKKEDITIDEIYSEINLDAVVAKEFEKLELAVEKQYCHANYWVKPLFDKIIQAGKRVVIVSDMYLPANFVDTLLKNNGFKGYEKIYMSGDIGKTKRHCGNLYKLIINDLDILSHDIIHIGDNFLSDYLMPKLYGIDAVKIPRYINVTFSISDGILFKTQNVLFAFINNRLGKYIEKTEAFKIGYEILGPILLGYVKWVHQQVINNKIEHAFFLARDMYLFIDVYKKLYGNSGISYLEVSRRSLRRAYVVAKKDIVACNDTLSNKQHSDIELARAMGVTVEKWKDLKLSNNIQPFIKDWEMTCSYLRQEGFFNDKRIATVDIGWRGTTQNALQAITGQHIKGLYWQICQREDFAKMDIAGCWGCCYSHKEAEPKIFGTAGMLEILLFPQVGTTVGYEKQNDKIVALHAPYEMLNTDKIVELQKGAMQFVDDCIKEKPDIENDDFILPFLNMATHPSKRTIEFFKSWCFEDNMKYTTICLRPWKEYLCHPMRFIGDFHGCYWKEGFLAQVLPGFVNPSWITRIMRRVIWCTKGMP